MKMKSLVLLAMAIGCGLVAMLGVQQVLSGDKKPPDGDGQGARGHHEHHARSAAGRHERRLQGMGQKDIPQGAVTTHEQYQERSLRVSAIPNEPIMVAKLNEKGVFGGSSEIPKGMRVATVPVTVTKTHSGLILPGDRVDVVVTYTMSHHARNQMNSQNGEIRKAKTILQYIEVFATDNIRQSAVPNGDDERGCRQEHFAAGHTGSIRPVDACGEQGTNLPGTATSRGQCGKSSRRKSTKQPSNI